MSILKNVDLGTRKRFGQMSKLLYMTDGLHQPKMYDGLSLVNWGITAPTTAVTQAASSSGANQLDTCELAWTPASITVLDGESAFALATGITNALPTTSADAKVGSTSSLLLLGYTSEPLTANTMLMLHMDGTDGQTVGILDSSAANRTATATGAGIELDTAYATFGTASMIGPGGFAKRLSFPTSTDWEPNLLTDSMTFECQVRFNAHNNAFGTLLVSRGVPTGASQGFHLAVTSTAIFALSGGTTLITRNYAFGTGVTYHIRFCTQAGLAFIFVNGVRQGLPEVVPAHPGTGPIANVLNIGGTDQALGAPTTIDGWIDEVRWEKGVAFATSDFVPPTVAYGSFVAPVATPLGILGTVAYKNLTPADYSGYYGVKVWVKSLVPVEAGDLSLNLCSGASGLGVLEAIDIPQILTNEWTQITYKFTNPALLTAVTSIGLSVNRDIGQNAIYIDDMQAIRCNVTREDRAEYITQGAASVRFEIPGNIPDGTLLAYKTLPSTDMHSDTVVSFSLRCDKELGTQQLKYLLDDTAACASPLESIYMPDLLAADIFNNVQLTLANPAALVAVISEGLYIAKRNLAPCNIWIDDIKRAVSTSGNLDGRYFTWCSFYSSKYDRESDLSPISGVVDCVGQAIALTNIPISADTQVDMRRIYRSAAGGTVPYLDSTINDNTTVALVLNKSDASLLASVRHPSLAEGSGKFAPPPAAAYLVQHKNRFSLAGSLPYNRGTLTATNASATFTFTSAQLDDSFIGRTLQIIGDATSYYILSVNAVAKTCVARPLFDLVAGGYQGVTGAGKTYYITSGSDNTVYTSYVDDNDTARPHGFPIEYAQDIIEGEANDILMGLGIVGNATLAMKRLSTHLLEGNYPPFTVSKLSSVIGCISHDTIVQDENASALWLSGEQGVAYCDGSSVSIISQKIQEIFSAGHVLSLNAARFSYAHAVYDAKNKLYYLFCSSAASSVNDVCIVLDRSVGTSDPNSWNWYYFTGIEASASTIVYSSTGLASIYITDYDGFQYQLNTGWYDGIASGTLSGTATSAAASTLNDTGATFYTTGSGLRNIPLLIYKVSTGETWVYKITTNTGTQLTISGAFTEIPNTSDYKYYIGGYQIDWKSKQFELLRPTDKKLLMDGVLNNYKLAASQKIRIQLLKNLAGSQIANQLRDLSEGEEQVFLIRERVSQAQWQISGFIHGQNIQIVSLGLRLKGRGIR